MYNMIKKHSSKSTSNSRSKSKSKSKNKSNDNSKNKEQKRIVCGKSKSKSKTGSKEKNKKHMEVKDVVNVKKDALIKNDYKDFEDWASHHDHIYIGRNMTFYVPGTNESIWHNPYPVAVPGKKYKDKKNRYTREESMRLYKQYVLSNPTLMSKLNELNGKVLGCWCKPLKCHGDILAEIVKDYCN